MANDDVDIRVRMRGAKQAERDARGVASGLDRVGSSSRRAATQLAFLRGAGKGASGMLSDFGGAARRGSFYLGGFAATAAGFAARSGLKFNATMEQNTVAFANFLGSTKKAEAFLGRLYNLAAKTPFQFTDLTQASVKLLGFGMNVKRVEPLMRTLGDAIAGVGGGADEIARVTTAIGQIQAKGKLSMEELNQLAEARIPAMELIRKELKMTRKEFSATFTPGNQIPASKALPALERGMKKAFGGSAAKQAKTFNGQLSSMKDYLDQTLGSVTHGGFVYLRDKVFPHLTSGLQDVQKTFKRTDLDFAGKMRVAGRQLRREMGPVADEVKAGIRDAHLDQALSDFVEQASPKIADAMGKAAGKAATAFASAWWHAGPWGKLFLALLPLWKFGVFSTAGRIAADRFVARFFPTAAAAMAAETAGATAVATGFAGVFVAALGPALIAAGIGGVVMAAMLDDTAPGTERDPRKRNTLDGTKPHGPSVAPGTSWWERTHPGSPTNPADDLAPGAKPFSRRPHSPRTVGPRALPKRPPLAALPRARGASAGSVTEVHTHVHLDGRQVAKSVERHQTNAKNRK